MLGEHYIDYGVYRLPGARLYFHAAGYFPVMTFGGPDDVVVGNILRPENDIAFMQVLAMEVAAGYDARWTSVEGYSTEVVVFRWPWLVNEDDRIASGDWTRVPGARR